jgi:hypothetical protein
MTFVYSFMSTCYRSVADPDPGPSASCAFMTPGSESGMNIPDNISESLEQFLGLKIL